MTRPMGPVVRIDAQRGKRAMGPYARGLGRWPQHFKSLAIERHSQIPYPGWLNIPMKTINGQSARKVLGPWSAVNDTTEHLKTLLVKEIEELIFQQEDSHTVVVTSATLRPVIKAHINSSAWRGLMVENGGIFMCSRV
eukprot:Em0104g7a